MFITAVFLIVKNWKEHKYPMGGDQINYLCKMEYSVTIKE